MIRLSLDLGLGTRDAVEPWNIRIKHFFFSFFLLSLYPTFDEVDSCRCMLVCQYAVLCRLEYSSTLCGSGSFLIWYSTLPVVQKSPMETILTDRDG